MKIGFLDLLTLVFVIGKVFEYLDWSWWLVMSPVIIRVVLTFIILFAYEWIKDSRK